MLRRHASLGSRRGAALVERASSSPRAARARGSTLNPVRRGAPDRAAQHDAGHDVDRGSAPATHLPDVFPEEDGPLDAKAGVRRPRRTASPTTRTTSTSAACASSSAARSSSARCAAATGDEPSKRDRRGDCTPSASTRASTRSGRTRPTAASSTRPRWTYHVGRRRLLRRLRRQPVEHRGACEARGRPRRHDPARSSSSRASRAAPGRASRTRRSTPRVGSRRTRSPSSSSRATRPRRQRPDPDDPRVLATARRASPPPSSGDAALHGTGHRHRVPHPLERPRRRLPDAPLRRRQRARHRGDAAPPDERLGDELPRGQRVREPAPSSVTPAPMPKRSLGRTWSARARAWSSSPRRTTPTSPSTRSWTSSQAPASPPPPHGEPITYTLDQGQYIQFTQQAELSGSAIQSDQPVALIAGSTIMDVPVTQPKRADHGEQMIPPVQALGSQYVGVRYRTRNPSGAEESVPWRIDRRRRRHDAHLRPAAARRARDHQRAPGRRSSTRPVRSS